MKHPFISSKYGVKLWKCTPNMAAYILAHYNNMNPRKMDMKEVNERLAEAMRNNHFEEQNGNPILFNKEGKLLNGQHRLQAVVVSGRTITFVVIYGVPDSAAKYIDRNKPRSIGVAMALELGLSNDSVNHLNRVAAVVRLALRFKHNWKKSRFVIEDILAFYGAHTKIVEEMLEIPTANPNADRAGFRAACIVYALRHHETASKLFRAVIGSGDDIKPHSSPYLLRNYLAQNNSTENHPEQQLRQDFGRTFYAANNYATKRIPKLAEQYQW